ncbi:MAG: hypothetical protein DYG88_15755 [Chloroflexi bacterium CFX4]|nr:hypothetical protein [Chloroflexi bacterium CFX4]MDL1921812.1 hypothetical protein [Chloroflexi bacterium CFX3]
MTCTHPLPLSDDDLLDILLGDPDPSLVECLESDKESQARYQKMLNFHRKMHRAFHPSDQTLVDYVSGMLSEPHRQAIDSHLSECRQCRTTIEAIRLPTFDQAAAAAEAPALARPKRQREIHAHIVKQPQQGLAYFGGEQIASPRMVQAEAEGITIMLKIMSEARGVRLIGSIDSSDPNQQERWNGAQLQLSHGDDVILTTLLRYGEFQCSAVPPSVVTLRFKPLAGQVVALYDLPLE